MNEFNIVIAGVGGQGVILMSELLGNAAVADGLNVRGSEVLGMAVRGGSVSSTIRLGDEALAPLAPAGKADVLVGMEPAETLRNIGNISGKTLVIMNMEKVIPFTVSSLGGSYPELDTILENIHKATDTIIQLNATKIASEAGSTQSANVVMLGALFGQGQLPIKIETVKNEITARFNERVAPINIKAFDLGYEEVQKALA
ncbi:MAG: indolepyruvate oxidoreductase subunit beta [Dehalococcoidales bacterium]|nr:MAG: indolepyruvate oxidoreductase subunit beta [Dehalococcoidales bacterium]